jgi:hypothetical protein
MRVVYNASMHTLTRHRLLRARIAWIACLAILFNAFAPLVSHAMAAAPAPAAMSMEICTALGMTTMPLALPADGQDGPDGSASGALHKAMNHCGYCISHAAAHGLPPPPPAIAFAAAAGRDVYPPLYYHSPRPLFPWSLAQSRAPPAA